MSHVIFRIAAAFVLLVAAAETVAAQSPAPSIVVHVVGADADRMVEVDYRGIDRPMDFRDHSDTTRAAIRQPMWTATGDCLGIDAAQLVPRRAGCLRGGFRIRPALLHRDRMYEPALPFRNGGVLLDARYLALDAPAPVRWRFEPPRGGVVIVHGQVSRRPVEFTAGAGDRDEAAYVYLGPAPTRSHGERVVVVDDDVAPSMVVAVERALAIEDSTLLPGLGMAGTRPLAIFLHADATAQPGFHGDVTDDDMMRLSFLGNSTESMPAADVAKFVLHEIVHVHQPRDSGEVPVAPWLSEGNAEFLSLIALTRAGTISPSDAAARMRTAVAACLVDVGDTAWASRSRDQGQTPYDCGLALHVLDALDTHADPLARWGKVFRDPSGWSVAMPGAEAIAALLAGQQPFASGVAARFAVNGAVIEPPTDRDVQDFGMKVRGMTFAPLMAADCDGQISFWNEADGIRTEPNEACAVLKAGHRIVALAGADLLAHPFETAAAVATACAEARSVSVRDAAGGTLTLPCGESYAAPRQLPRLDAAALVSVLRRP